MKWLCSKLFYFDQVTFVNSIKCIYLSFSLFCGFCFMSHSSGNLDNFASKSRGEKLEEREREREKKHGNDRFSNLNKQCKQKLCSFKKSQVLGNHSTHNHSNQNNWSNGIWPFDITNISFGEKFKKNLLRFRVFISYKIALYSFTINNY